MVSNRTGQMVYSFIICMEVRNRVVCSGYKNDSMITDTTGVPDKNSYYSNEGGIEL